MRFVLFEDHCAPQFSPLALLRPIFELRCGHFSLRERLQRNLVSTGWGVWVRPELADTYRAEHPEARVNDTAWLSEEPTLLINGRWLTSLQEIRQINPEFAGWNEGSLVYVTLKPQDSIFRSSGLSLADILLMARQRPALQVNEPLLEYPWDVLARNHAWLEVDFQTRPKLEPEGALPAQSAVVGARDDVFIHPTAKIDPFVVLDATRGPIWIDEGARVQAFTRIEGPAFIGRGTQLFRANIREGCSIGPVCRVGGEVEESIFHSHANKYHDGFLGHSYICPWVNLGALTTNSDLKNDYSEVRVSLAGSSIQSGLKKVGAFIGDHSKTAIGSFFNTGSSVGIMSLVLPGGELLPKYIPSFSRVWHGKLQELPDGCESGIATARMALGRRDETLTPAQERLIRHQFAATAAERKRALAR